MTSDSPEVRISAEGLIIESEYCWSVMFSFPPDVLKVVVDTFHTPPRGLNLEVS